MRFGLNSSFEFILGQLVKSCQPISYVLYKIYNARLNI